MGQKIEGLGSFWDDWQKETEELAKANREKVEIIKREAMERQKALKSKEDIVQRGS